MVNGALGSCNGSMDMIKLVGGEPANFAGCKAAANCYTTVEGWFPNHSSGSNVKAILINYLWHRKCDRIASGVVELIDYRRYLGFLIHRS